MSGDAGTEDRTAVPLDRRTILAMGGGGFMDERSLALDLLALELAGASVPRVCFLPTASGDPREQGTRFFDRFRSWPCEPSILSLFHLARDRVDPVSHLLAQDVIYVGGGSMRNMLAIWREHGIDAAMRLAWSRGTVLAGLSAGAMCWFEGGVSKSGGTPEAVAGIGLLGGSLSVHLDSEPERLPVYCDAVASGRLPSGYAADDGAALVYGGLTLRECVGSRADARVLRVQAAAVQAGRNDAGGPGAADGAGGSDAADGAGGSDAADGAGGSDAADGAGGSDAADGAGGSDAADGVICSPVPVRVLPGAAGTADGRVGSLESHGVAELRELRAGPRRWD